MRREPVVLSENPEVHAAKRLQQVCQNHEKNFVTYMRDQPAIFSRLSGVIKQVDSADLCMFAARETIYEIPNYEQLCRQIAGGLLETGLLNTMMVIY